MAERFNGPSRTLSALDRQFASVVWQAGKPPLDHELNLMAQIAWERMREALQSQSHSGFLLDPVSALTDYEFNSAWSNYFKFGRQQSGELEPILWALVNGWVVPVVGTAVSADTDTSHLVKLFPPPATDARTDLVFLEVWLTQVGPNPSTTNKPSASTVYKWGNVEYGGTNITDDIEDPAFGFETTERLQLQYRIRVFGQGAGSGSSVALDQYPDGLDDPNVLGQGVATAPVSGMVFTNMRETLGDPSLWRAGDGDATNSLGTYDGYVYAIPLCAVFRRNANAFVAVETSGNANQNGSFDRNPSAASLTNPRDGAKAFGTATLTNAIDEDDTGAIQVTGLTNSGWDDPSLSVSSTFMVIDGEVMGISAVDTTAGTITIPTGGRGRNGSMALPHSAGASIGFFNSRPDGRFADEIAAGDVLDLRRGISLGQWDYDHLLRHNLTKLILGRLQTCHKQSDTGDTQGPSVVEVDYLYANGAASVPNQTQAVDGPDGIRTIWSDAAVIQPGVTVLLDDEATQTSGSVTSFDAVTEWDVGADFKPSGFMTDATGFNNGSVFFLHIGGDNGSEGARATFRDTTERAVRFLSPREYWKTDDPDSSTGLQKSVTLRFIEEDAMNPAAPGEVAALHPGPMYPLASENFEKPFMFLGGLLHNDLQVSAVTLVNDSPSSSEYEIDLPGLDFDTAGTWFSLETNGDMSLSTTGSSKTLINSTRTLYDMLTNGGQDRTGASSEVYIVVYGDDTNADNNGVFKVVGAGTAGYTDKDASAADRLRVEFICQGVTEFTLPSSGTLNAEVRSQHCNSQDGTGFTDGKAAACVVLTDLEGAGSAPWAAGTLGANAISQPIASKAILSTSLLYHPGRGGTARVADEIRRVAVRSAGANYLRQAGSTLDSTFSSESGVASAETHFDSAHVQVWNRLSGLGLDGSAAPAHGGEIIAFSEQDREVEVFFDKGSKSLVFRPFLDRSMTMFSVNMAASSLVGATTYPGPAPTIGTDKDGATIFTSNLRMGFVVPWEYMPRFGRQDIPYHDTSVTTGTFLPGINHLFTDDADETKPVFYVVGGQNNDSAGNLVSSLYLQTGSTSGLDYGEYGTIAGPATPAYQARLVTDTTVVSSDLGRTLKGIELPPYLGIARLYGVYDRRNFIDKGGATFDADRVTVSSDAATNLLRKDAKAQTLFIRKGGANDVTGDADDHTYVIPSNALDISLSPDYVSGETFDDLEYVVECVVFGFARGFINLNNFVLARRNTGAGAAVTEGTNVELEGINMTIPAAAPLNDQVYVGYDRTVYQGDPYMTRAGSTRTTSDYQHRYGQIAVSDAYALATPIQQFDSSGVLQIETPNRRVVQVLASIDFYTTLGTGKVGGQLKAGTILDVGYTEDTAAAASRVPASASANPWRILPRAFSEGQRENNSRASVLLQVIANGSLTGAILTIYNLSGTKITLTAVSGSPADQTEFQVGADAAASIVNLVAGINAHTSLTAVVTARTEGDDVLLIEAVPVGAQGNGIKVSHDTPAAFKLLTPTTPEPGVGTPTAANLRDGSDLVMNAGSGTSQIDLTGMTERLPLGILLQDSDFLCEDPLGNKASAMQTLPPGIRPVQTLLPLTNSGSGAYTRFTGGAGHWVGMADGGILAYTAYHDVNEPTGSKKYRLYRGGGSVFVMDDPNPGGPVDWVSGALEASLKPVLKGGVLVCKAMLVRNFPEQAFSTNAQVSQGDEVQMVVATYGLLGSSIQDDGLSLSGIISPSGYGEGYAAADRYRLEGRPMVKGRRRSSPDVAGVVLAVYSGGDVSSTVG